MIYNVKLKPEREGTKKTKTKNKEQMQGIENTYIVNSNPS